MRARGLRTELEHDRARKKLADLDSLAASNPYFQRQLDRLNVARDVPCRRARSAGTPPCDELYAFTPIDAAYTWQTSNAIGTFQRGAMILPTGMLDQSTRDALVMDSRERDFRARAARAACACDRRERTDRTCPQSDLA